MGEKYTFVRLPGAEYALTISEKEYLKKYVKRTGTTLGRLTAQLLKKFCIEAQIEEDAARGALR